MIKPQPVSAMTATDAMEGDAPAALLDDIVAASSPAARIALPSGRVVEARPDERGERVTVRGLSGEVEVEVLLTERGPVLRFRAADLELSAAGEVRVDCDRFAVQAKNGILQESGGDVVLRGAAARIEAERGDVEIEANDDVQLRGERIKLNC